MAIKNGTAGADTLIGTTLADQLFGLGGNDILKGLAGPDLLDGGAGRDTADYSGAAGLVDVSLDSGLGFFGDAAGDSYVSIENVVGSAFNDVIGGNGAANRLDGGAGFDFIFGGGGSDILLGAGGDDFLQGGAGADVISGGAGQDRLSYGNSVLGVNVNLSTGQAIGGDAAGDIFKSIESLLGSPDNDILAGSAAANVIQGDDGGDRLFGFAGKDTLRGEGGADTITGGEGADTFVFFAAADSPAGFIARDVIQDFSRAQGDRLDLGFIDANADSSGIDSFEFLGKDALTDGPGQISYTFQGNTTVVQISTTGGGINNPPEIEIQLQGQIDLVASDFLL